MGKLIIVLGVHETNEFLKFDPSYPRGRLAPRISRNLPTLRWTSLPLYCMMQTLCRTSIIIGSERSARWFFFLLTFCAAQVRSIKACNACQTTTRKPIRILEPRSSENPRYIRRADAHMKRYVCAKGGVEVADKILVQSICRSSD